MVLIMVPQVDEVVLHMGSGMFSTMAELPAATCAQVVVRSATEDVPMELPGHEELLLSKALVVFLAAGVLVGSMRRYGLLEMVGCPPEDIMMPLSAFIGWAARTTA